MADSTPVSRRRSRANAAAAPRWRRWARIAGWLVIVAAGVPVLQVTLVRFVNPVFTPLMLLRWSEARLGGEFRGGVDYRWRDWDVLPDEFLRAVWVSEDSRFFEHRGFDWVEMRAALARARRTGGDPRGSSTITMQCARSAFLWTGRSYLRKGLEAYYTLLMEAILPKRRIFELYANVIEMGDGIYGVEAAAQRQFGIPAARLSASQGAMLAAILPFPRGWNPNRQSPRLRWRHRHVLRELAAAPPKWPAGMRAVK